MLRHPEQHEQQDRIRRSVPVDVEQAVKHEYATAEALASDRRQAHFRAANAAGADLYLTVNALVPGTHNREKRDVRL